MLSIPLMNVLIPSFPCNILLMILALLLASFTANVVAQTVSPSVSPTPSQGFSHRLNTQGWPILNYTYAVGASNDPHENFFSDQLTQWQMATMNDFFTYTPNITLPGGRVPPSQGVGSLIKYSSNAQAWLSMRGVVKNGSAITYLVFPDFFSQYYLNSSSAGYNPADISISYIFDFSPLAAVVLKSNTNIKSFQDFLDMAKANPAKIVTGGGAKWSASYIGAFSVMRITGLNFIYLESESYSSGISMLMNSSVTLAWVPLYSAVNNPSLNVLAVAALDTDADTIQYPTFRQSGVDYTDGVYRGIGVPSNTPAQMNLAIGTDFDRMQQAYSAQAYLAGGISISGNWITVYYGNRIPFINYTSTGFATRALLTGTPVNTLLSSINFTYTSAFTFTPAPPVDTTVISLVDKRAIYTMFALAGVGLIAAALGSYAFYHHRAHPVFVAASLPFCSIMIVGFVLGYLSMIVLSIDPALDLSQSTRNHLCRAFPWMFGLAFNLIFGPLLAKTWRLVMIFYNKALMISKNITNVAILKNVGILILVEVAFQLTWLLVDPLQSQLISLDATHVSYSCQCDHQWIFMGIMIATKVILLLVGIGLAIKTRNLDSQFNESKSIGFSLYNIFFCALIAIPFVSLIKSFVTLQYVVMNVAIWLCLTICLAALLVPKVLIAMGFDPLQPFSFRKTTGGSGTYNNKKTSSAQRTGSMRGSHNNSHNNNNNTSELGSGVSHVHLMSRTGSNLFFKNTDSSTNNNNMTNSPRVPMRNLSATHSDRNNSIAPISTNAAHNNNGAEHSITIATPITPVLHIHSDTSTNSNVRGIPPIRTLRLGDSTANASDDLSPSATATSAAADFTPIEGLTATASSRDY